MTHLVAALALVLLAVAAAPAAAAEPLRVSGPGGSVEVERDPFRLTFRDASGRTVLRQVPGEGAAPRPFAGVHPEPGGTDNVDEPGLYAPLVFTVGNKEVVQEPGTQWEGNLLGGYEAGVQFSARAVEQATRDGDALRLMVSTTDPSGRRVELTIAPQGHTFRVSVRPTPDAGVATMGDAFETPAGEAFRGFGGRHNAIDQRGNDFFNWIEEENFGAGPFKPLIDVTPGAGGDRYLFPGGPTAAYYVQPMFVSSRGYGFLLDQPELSRFRLAADRPDAWQAAVAAPRLEYVVAPGEAPRAIGSLTALTGRHREPPDWVLGPITGVNLTAETLLNGDAYEQAVRGELDRLDRSGLRFSAFVLEGWITLSDERNRTLIEEVRRRGMVPLVYFTPFLNAASQPEETQRYSVRTAAGTPYVYTSPFGLLSVVDFTNPDAIRWWQGRIRHALELGAEGFMQDWGEQVQLEMRFHDGSTGRSMHNGYPVAYHRATRELLDHWEAEHRGKRIFFFTRSGYTGSARHEGGNFPGDENADFSRSNGLGFLTTDMVSRGIGGAYGFSTDIGGYVDSYTPMTQEVWTRWVQWAALSPVFRLHNSVSNGTRQPWHWDEATQAIYRRATALRERARPLIAELWREAFRTGIPIARPMWLAFPGDAEAAKQDQQWMLGDDVLVAPVAEEGATKRWVYFPAGCWRHGETRERFNGAGEREVAAPIDRLPWFVRCGKRPLEDAAAACRDRLAPRTLLARRSLRVSRTRVAAAGTASDRGCRTGAARVRGRVARVDMSVAMVGPRGCRFVGRDGRLERRWRSCRRATLLPARGTTRWRFARRVSLPPGRYRLQVRATDASRNKERPAPRARALFALRR